jgi:hypothetical protein
METERRCHQRILKESTLDVKRKMRIGCWNVRTMREVGQFSQVAVEAEVYHIDLSGLSETRWSEFGEIKTKVGSTLIYCGKQQNEGNQHENEVGILMSRRWKNNLLNWDSVSDRIIVDRFECKIRNITVVRCYAPTEVANKEEKQKFYAQIREVFASIKKQDIVILMGDFNAKVEVRNEGLEQVMGKHGKGDRNENGEMSVEFCMEQELVIGGTLLKHKECHKVTWVPPDGKIENQKDHIAISQKWRKSLLDTRNKRGADIGSDHHLVVAELRLKISASKKPFIKVNKEFDVQKLRNKEIQKKFTIKLENCYKVLQQFE